MESMESHETLYNRNSELYDKLHDYTNFNIFTVFDFSHDKKDIGDSKYISGLGVFNSTECEDMYYANLEDLPYDIVSLCLSSRHDRKIDRFPEGLLYLQLAFNYNHLLDNLPKNLTHLMLNIEIENNDILNYLPATLEYLSMINFKNFDLNFDFLPIGLKYLRIPKYYNGALNNLPAFLEVLDLYGGYDGRIEELPASVQTIIISQHRGYDIADEYVHLVKAI